MSRIRRAFLRLLATFRPDALDDDFDDEAAAHLALAIEEHTARGMPPHEAGRLARQRFGAVAASRDAHRDARALPWLEELAQDVRRTLRGLRRDRGFTAAVVVMLTVSVSLNATVFTIVQAMLFRGLPLAGHSDRLAHIQVRQPSGPWGASWEDLERWRTETQAFEGVAYVGQGRIATLRDDYGRPLEMMVPRVTVNTFGLLGVRPVIGRDFTVADESAAADPVAIVSHQFWITRYGQRPDVIGAIVHINDVPVTIVGVMPERFVLFYERDLWMALKPAQVADRQRSDALVFGRLATGATFEQARAEVATIHRRVEAASSETERRPVPLVLTHSEAFVAEEASSIYVSLWAGAVFVLLIAYANVANLALVRTLGRWREFSTRVALGAGQWRMLRQVAVEHVMLTSAAALLGWLIVRWSVPTWERMTKSPYVALDYSLATDVVAYLLVISAVAALLCALPSLVRVAQLGASGALPGDARGVTQSLRGKHLSMILVTSQVALALVLLVGAGLLIRSLVRIVGADTGIGEPQRVIVGTIRLAPGQHESAEAAHAYYRRLEETLRAIPGADAVALSTTLPVIGGGPSRPIEIEGRRSAPDQQSVVSVQAAGTDYFAALGRNATNGHLFTDGDNASAPPIAIVNERFAAMFWPGEHPVGKRLRVVGSGSPGPWMAVVGVVPNIKQSDPVRQEFKPLVYVPFAQEPIPRGMNSTTGTDGLRGANILVRTRGAPEQMVAAVRVSVERLDPGVILQEVRPLERTLWFNRDLSDMAHAELGKHSVIAPIYAAVALLLAAIGLYAVVAHSVGQRTQEIGVRMVVGASAANIRTLILRESLLPVSLGLAIGLLIAFGVTGAIRSQLVDVSPYDPMTLLAALALLSTVAIVACLVPVRRALRIEPTIALRQE